VIKKPRERGGHSPCWAAEPEKIIIIIIIMLENTFLYLEPLYCISEREGKYIQREENTLLIVYIVKCFRRCGIRPMYFYPMGIINGLEFHITTWEARSLLVLEATKWN
jgi:hypothetical protein